MAFACGVILLALCHAVFARVAPVEPDYLDMLELTGQEEKLARMLGLEDASLLRPNMEERSDDGYMFTKVSPLGDILVPKEHLEQGRQGLKSPSKRWPNNELPYSITRVGFLPAQLKKIEDSISQLNSLLKNVKIVPRTSQADYVRVMNGNGCSSYLGRTGGAQVLTLQSTGCLSTGTIQHEFIHALGFAHEHNRPDRDDYVRVLEENISPEWRSQYRKVSAEDYGIQGPYEHYSVMHYPYNAPNSNKPAFEIFDPAIEPAKLGQREGATPTDVQKVDTLYARN